MSRELPPKQRVESLVSPEKERHPYLGLFGATGAGKSELGKVLKKDWKVGVFEEEFEESPFLERFYQNPSYWSFKHEMYFLEAKIPQMRQLKPLLFEGMQVHDPALWLDTEVYAFVQHEMRWMSDYEYRTYQMAVERLSAKVGLPEPDLVIVTLAPPDIVCQRIEQRGRPYEVKFMKKYPDYFPRLATRVMEWVEENPHGVPMVKIDTGRFNYVLKESDRAFVIKEVRRGIKDNLFGASGEGRTNDGMRLILPAVFQTSHTG